MELRVLGHRLTVKDDDGAPVDISRRQVRELVCVLALETSSVVPNAALFERLWEPSDTNLARSLTQAVYNARRVLPQRRLRTENGGYRLHLVDTDYLDLIDFQRMSDQARAARSVAPRTAASLYQQLLSLWGTPPLGDLPPTVGMEPLRQSLLSGMRDAREDLVEILLRLRDFRGVISSALRWQSEDPLNEHLCGLLMLALSSVGRKTEALRAYRDLTTHLGPQARPGPWLESVAAQITDNRHETELGGCL